MVWLRRVFFVFPLGVFAWAVLCFVLYAKDFAHLPSANLLRFFVAAPVLFIATLAGNASISTPQIAWYALGASVLALFLLEWRLPGIFARSPFFLIGRSLAILAIPAILLGFFYALRQGAASSEGIFWLGAAVSLFCVQDNRFLDNVAAKVFGWILAYMCTSLAFMVVALELMQVKLSDVVPRDLLMFSVGGIAFGKWVARESD